MKVDYTPKVDALLGRAMLLEFSRHDFVDLAVASADQAGMTADQQSEFRDWIEASIFGVDACSHQQCGGCGSYVAGKHGPGCEVAT